MEASNADVADVFVYDAGPGGESPPQNVVRVRVDPSVTSIHASILPMPEFDRGGAM